MADSKAEVAEAEIVDTRPGERSSLIPTGSVMEAIAAAEFDRSVVTAKKFPRSIERFKAKLKTLTCATQAIADSCFYTLPPRDNSGPISGPSIRFAEIAAQCWGNLRSATRIVDIGDDFITVMAVCHDLEDNVFNAAEYIAQIVNKKGQRYSFNMIATTAAAAQKKALRNAIITTIPRAYINEIMDEVRNVAAGKLADLRGTVNSMVAIFKKDFGVEPLQILHAFRYESFDQFEAKDVADMRGYYQAIRQEELKVEDVFQPIEKAQPEQPPAEPQAPPAGKKGGK